MLRNVRKKPFRFAPNSNLDNNDYVTEIVHHVLSFAEKLKWFEAIWRKWTKGGIFCLQIYMKRIPQPPDYQADALPPDHVHDASKRQIAYIYATNLARHRSYASTIFDKFKWKGKKKTKKKKQETKTLLAAKQAGFKSWHGADDMVLDP